jgi:hypothetical protein
MSTEKKSSAGALPGRLDKIVRPTRPAYTGDSHLILTFWPGEIFLFG